MKNLETTTVFVNPVPRTSAQGRHKQMFTVHEKSGELRPTTNMNKNKEFGIPSYYQFQLNASTNKLVTGLDKPTDNIFKGLDAMSVIEQYGLSQDWAPYLEKIVKQDQIKLQTKYEILDNVPYNYYTNDIANGSTLFNSTSSANKNQKIEPNFLQKFSIMLYDKANRFSDDTQRGRIAIALIKIHPKIAKSKKELNSAIHDWYISEENEAVVEKNRKRDVIQKAVSMLVNLRETTSPYTQYKVASLLTNHEGNVIIKGKVNDSRVKEALSDYVDDGAYQMENVDKFVKIYNLATNGETRPKFDIRYLVQQAINTGVMGNRDGYILWHSKAGTPNMYKHTDYDKLVNLLLQEYMNYNEDDLTTTNWYKDLLTEVASKGVWLEK